MPSSELNNTVESYVNRHDWRIKENSNTNYSFAGLQGHLANVDLTEWALDNMYTGEVSSAHRDKLIHIHDMSHPMVGYCFTGDTKVKLLSGEVKSFKELIDEKYDNFYVYSKDSKGNVVPGLAHSVRLTRKSAELVKVTLDNGYEIRCTPDHEFLLRDGTYCKAEDLVSGTSLMPEYFKKNRYGYVACKYTYPDGHSTHRALHRIILEHKLGRELSDNEVGHHINGDKFNNSPDNLEVMIDNEHRSLELGKTRNTPKFIEANRERLIKHNKSESQRKIVSEKMSNYNSEHNVDKNKSDYQRACVSFNKSSSEYSKSSEVKSEYLDYVMIYGFLPFKKYINSVMPNNHKVMSVEHLNYTEDVYDMTVDTYHNFLLDAGVYVHNCSGWGMKMLVTEGFNCGANYVYSRPAKHLDSLYGQLNNFIFTMSGEWAGAQAFNSVDTYSAAFIKNDNMSDDDIYKAVRQLVYNLNIKTRVAMQAPFSNFSIDITVPDDLVDKPAIIGGEEVDFTYGDCQPEMDRFNKILCKVMMEGDGMNKIFTFPIITFGITNDFPWDSELAESIFTFADEANSPYFSNFINSSIDQSDVRSMCCRLRLDLRELINVGGGVFGSGDSTGSNGVVTLNLSRIGYMSRVLSDRNSANPDDYKMCKEILSHYQELNARVNVEMRSPDSESKMRIYYMFIEYFMDLGRRSLLIKRDVVQESIDRGLVPYTKRYLGNIDHHFNTLGVNAGNEMCINLIGKDISTEEGCKLAEDTLNFMLKKLSDYQEMDNGKLLWNLEATPAEGCGTRFAKGDRQDFSDIITGAGTNMEFYTNSTQLPEDYSENVFEVFEHQNKLQPLYTSGTVQHIYMNEPTHNWKVIQSLVRKLFTNYNLPYISISPDICVCSIHGRLPHNYKYCPYEHTQDDINKLLEKGIITEDDIKIFEGSDDNYTEDNCTCCN